MIRRGHARRAAASVEVGEVDVRFGQPVTAVVARPPVTVHVPSLEVVVHCAGGDARQEQVTVVEPDIWVGVDVVPVRLAESMFAVRTARFGIGPATVRSMPLPVAEARTQAVRLAAAEDRAATPAALDLVHRSPTSMATIPHDRLGGWLRQLFRASRLASPAELEVVGIYERVPGGAIVSIAEVDGGVALRVNPRGRPWPATLIVGRARGGSTLIPIEVDGA